MKRRTLLKLLTLSPFLRHQTAKAASPCLCCDTQNKTTDQPPARWWKRHLGFTVYDDLPYLSRDTLIDITVQALAEWGNVTGLQFTYGGNDIHIHTTTDIADGAAAYAGYPPPTGQQWAGGIWLSRNLWLTLNDSDHTNERRCDLRYLIRHELGHALGFPHYHGPAPSVMASTFQYPAQRTLGLPDIAAARARYHTAHLSLTINH